MQPSKTNDLHVLFDSFDKDKNGTIEKTELKQIASHLGYQIQQKQLSQIMDAIDINGDGKISFKQFKKLWDKGIEGKLRQLVILQWKALKVTTNVSKYLKEASVAHNSQEGQTIQTYNYSAKYLEKEKSNFDLGFQIFIKGDKFHQKIEELTKQYVEFNHNISNITISLYIPKPEQLKNVLQKLINQLNKIIKQQSGITIDSFFKINLTVFVPNCLQICFSATQITQPFIQELIDPILKYIQSLGKNFALYTKQQMNCYAKFNDIVNQHANSPIKQGFKFQFQLKTIKNFVDIIKHQKFLSKNSYLLKEKNNTKVIKTQQQLEQFKNQLDELLDLNSIFIRLFLNDYRQYISKLKQVFIDKSTQNNMIEALSLQLPNQLFSGQQFKVQINFKTNEFIGSWFISATQPNLLLQKFQ